MIMRTIDNSISEKAENSLLYLLTFVAPLSPELVVGE
jgi:hypothetical protein